MEEKSREERNFEYLQPQVKYSGFQNDLDEQLRKNIGKESFILEHVKEINGDQVTSKLHFSSSKLGNSFFNKFIVDLEKKNGEHLQQTVFINKGEKNYTLHGVCNLLNGRFVEREKKTKEGVRYVAWDKLDLTTKDKYGNYPVVSFGERHGFKLEETLDGLGLVFTSQEEREQKLKGFRRGNRENVFKEYNGVKTEIFIEARVDTRQFAAYNKEGKMIDIKSGIVIGEALKETKGQKEEVSAQKEVKADKKKARSSKKRISA